jgi:hypothetical protein
MDEHRTKDSSTFGFFHGDFTFYYQFLVVFSFSQEPLVFYASLWEWGQFLIKKKIVLEKTEPIYNIKKIIIIQFSRYSVLIQWRTVGFQNWFSQIWFSIKNLKSYLLEFFVKWACFDLAWALLSSPNPLLISKLIVVK